MNHHDAPSAQVASLEIQHRVEQFLYYEARLIDDRRFDDWLELFTDDIHYWMPTRYNRLRREMDFENSGLDEAANFDDDKQSLRARIFRINSGMAWAEDPPSRTRHLITNVWIRPGDGAQEFKVDSNFLLYRSRGEVSWDLWVGRREDILRTAGPSYEIARRTIILDQATLLAKNLSVFF